MAHIDVAPVRSSNPPGPTGRFLLGTMDKWQPQPLKYMVELWQQYGDAVRFPFVLHFQGYQLTHPEHYKHILQDNNHNYTKQHPSLLMLQTVIGKGLLTNDGDSWLSQRRLMQPAFHRRQILEFSKLMATASERMVARWLDLPALEPVDMDEEMMRLTLEIVGRSLFSIDLTEKSETVGEAFTYANWYLSQMSARPFGSLYLRLPTRGNRQLRQSVKTLDTVVQQIIDQRRTQTPLSAAPDLLDILMQARDEVTGAGMTDRQLRHPICWIYSCRRVTK